MGWDIQYGGQNGQPVIAYVSHMTRLTNLVLYNITLQVNNVIDVFLVLDSWLKKKMEVMKVHCYIDKTEKCTSTVDFREYRLYKV